MTEITQDATVDVVDTCLNNITSRMGRKIMDLFIDQVGKTLPLIARPAGKYFPRPAFLRVPLVDAKNQALVLKAIEATRFSVPRKGANPNPKKYMLRWLPKEQLFVVQRVFTA